MNIYSYPLGPLQTNTYLLCNEQTKQAIIIDAGSDPRALIAQAQGYEVKAVLLTHAHFDHIAGLNTLREVYGAPVYIHAKEQSWLNDPDLNGSSLWPVLRELIRCAPAEYEVADEDVLELAGFRIRVLFTPGHSPGSVSFVIDQHLFSGDVLFGGSIGRTDLPGGDYDQLMESIKQKLLPLGDEVICYPGHGPQTTIGREKQWNSFLVGMK